MSDTQIPTDAPPDVRTARRWAPRLPHRRRAISCLTVVALVAGSALLAGCGASDDGGMSGGAPQATSTRTPSKPASRPDPGALARYRAECGQLTADTGSLLARIVYPRSAKMDVDNASTITAQVTLDQQTPAVQVIESEDATDKRGVVVSCLLGARLRASAAEFAVEPAGWMRQSLYSGPAEWAWQVTAKRAGTHHVILDVRPFVAVGKPVTAAQAVRDARIESSQIAVTVHDPGWLHKWMNSATAFLKDTYAFLVALAAVVAILVGWAKGWFSKMRSLVGS
jgi:hypothetical protein